MTDIPERAFETYTSVLQTLNDNATIAYFKEEFGSLYSVVETVINSFKAKDIKPSDNLFFKFIKGNEITGNPEGCTVTFYTIGSEAGWECGYSITNGIKVEDIIRLCDDAYATFKALNEENTFKKDEVDRNTFISTSEDPRSSLVKAYINKFPELESVVLKILEVFEHAGLVNHDPLEFNIKYWDEGSVELTFRNNFGWTRMFNLYLYNPDLFSNLTDSLQVLIMDYKRGFSVKPGFQTNPFTTPFNHQFTPPYGFTPNNAFGGYRSTTETPGGSSEEHHILNNPVVQNIIRREVTQGVNTRLSNVQQQLSSLQQQVVSLQQQIEFMKINPY